MMRVRSSVMLLAMTLRNWLFDGTEEEGIHEFRTRHGYPLSSDGRANNGLDIPSKSQFRKVIANNMTEDSTLIISTHQVHDVESLLDHIIIMNQSQLLLDASVSDICEKYTFEYRNPQEMDDTVLYAEPTLQGNAAICKRQEGEQETQMNLELLFNAVINGKLND